jgi:hypothetical protein
MKLLVMQFRALRYKILPTPLSFQERVEVLVVLLVVRSMAARLE